jgi:hypothetical protein
MSRRRAAPRVFVPILHCRYVFVAALPDKKTAPSRTHRGRDTHVRPLVVIFFKCCAAAVCFIQPSSVTLCLTVLLFLQRCLRDIGRTTVAAFLLRHSARFARARTRDHKVEGLGVCRLTQAGCVPKALLPHPPTSLSQSHVVKKFNPLADRCVCGWFVPGFCLRWLHSRDPHNASNAPGLF